MLTRGQLPSGLSAPQVDFRPFVEVSSVYDTGLTGVIVSDQGQLANTAAGGVEVVGGVSGIHAWEHTILELDYRGAFRQYTKQTYYDGTDQLLRLAITHKFSRHMQLNLRENGGYFTRDFGILGLPVYVPADPVSSYVPQTNFYDNRTFYAATSADFTIQKTARLSFNFGGDGFLTRRPSTALYGVTGAAARADVQYRLSRNMTVGAAYLFTEYHFTGVFGGTGIHSTVGSFSSRISRTMELSAYAGLMRVDNQFISSVPLDPVVAALLGETEGNVIKRDISYLPTFDGRLSKSLRQAMVYVGGSRTVTPGNGLFLTSKASAVFAGYTYTGLRRWSFNTTATATRSQSIGNMVGNYNNYGGVLSASRQVSRAVHAIFSFGVQQYSSGDVSNYNRVIYDARVGIGFAPGDVPVRFW